MRRTFVAVIVCGTALTACAGTGDPPAGSAAPPTSRSLDPNFDTGQTISISDGAFAPAWLVAVVGERIVWTNQSASPVEVVFDSGTVDSGPIAPGATFAYTPTAEVSIAYHAKGDPKMKGVIQVEPEHMPGETPEPS